MPINMDTKECVVKFGLISIMKELLEKNLVSEDEKPALKFQVDQHNYKVINCQQNGFDEEAVQDCLDVVSELFGLTTVLESQLYSDE